MVSSNLRGISRSGSPGRNFGASYGYKIVRPWNLKQWIPRTVKWNVKLKLPSLLQSGNRKKICLYPRLNWASSPSKSSTRRSKKFSQWNPWMDCRLNSTYKIVFKSQKLRVSDWSALSKWLRSYGKLDRACAFYSSVVRALISITRCHHINPGWGRNFSLHELTLSWSGWRFSLNKYNQSGDQGGVAR